LRLRDEIVKWQMKFYNSAEVSLDIYKTFLKKYSINRVALDYMEKREDLYKNPITEQEATSSQPSPSQEKGQEKIGIDLYYPWALIFT
jgi:hypothetical protein